VVVVVVVVVVVGGGVSWGRWCLLVPETRDSKPSDTIIRVTALP